MLFVANILIGIVAVLHIGFLVLEMFLWDHPVGRRSFKMTPEYYLGFKLYESGEHEEVYNGPGHLSARCVATLSQKDAFCSPPSILPVLAAMCCLNTDPPR